MQLFRHVSKTLKAMTKGVQANGDIEEENLDDAVSLFICCHMSSSDT